MATVAKLNVQIGAELSGLQKSLKSAQASLESFGRSASAIGSSMSTFITAPIVGGLGLAVKAASDAEETFSKFATVFRDVGAEAEDAFQTLRKEYGLSAQASKQLLGDTGDLLTGFGFAQDEALRLSTEVQKLAVDLASFTNFSGGAEGASQALTKALLGERESVKSLGIAILEEDVQKQMAINTAKGLTFATERQAKAQATLDLAIRQSQNAIGDYERTSDSFANQFRLLQTRIDDLTVTIGTRLLPFAEKLLDMANGVADSLENMSDEALQSKINMAIFVAALGPAIVVLGQASLAVSGLSKAMMFLARNPMIILGTAVVTLTGYFISLYSEAKKTRELLDDKISPDKSLEENLDSTLARIKELNSRLDELRKSGPRVVNGIVDQAGFEANLQSIQERLLKEQQIYAQLLNQSRELAKQTETNNALNASTSTREQINRSIAQIIEDNNVAIANIVENTLILTDADREKLALLTKVNGQLATELAFRERIAELQAKGVQTQAGRVTQLPDTGGLQQSTVDPDRYANSMAVLGSKIQTVTYDADGLRSGLDEVSNSSLILTEIGEQFTASFGAGMANIIVQGEKLKDVLSNIGRLLLSSAIQKGLSILLSGGLAGGGFFGSIASGGRGGILGALFSRRVNDALITSSGKVIEFSPKDNIMAMQDFGQLKTNSGGIAQVRVSVDDIRLSGSDILIALRNAERAYR
jgi:hypothetical protein